MHGLIADNIIAADVVLANGTLVHTSETERPDLLWALRGAGHNFGIVTEFQYKVHDLVDDGNWWTATYTYSRDQIRPVMEELNRMREYQTNRLTIAALYVWPNPQDPVVRNPLSPNLMAAKHRMLIFRLPTAPAPCFTQLQRED
jgi:FAD/FMN-containing dehydrogenase